MHQHAARMQDLENSSLLRFNAGYAVNNEGKSPAKAGEEAGRSRYFARYWARKLTDPLFHSGILRCTFVLHTPQQ
jgi:hypothetical protein